MFFPPGWSPVCADEVTILNHALHEFRRHGAEVLCISVDGVWCHRAFAKAKNLLFPLLSDFEPKGTVSRAYRAYRANDGTSVRALFLIDEAGVLRWSNLARIDVNAGADRILEALESLGPVDSRHENGWY